MLRLLLPHCERSTRLLLGGWGASGVLHVLAAALIISWGAALPLMFPPPQGVNSIELTASSVLAVEMPARPEFDSPPVTVMPVTVMPVEVTPEQSEPALSRSHRPQRPLKVPRSQSLAATRLSETDRAQELTHTAARRQRFTGEPPKTTSATAAVTRRQTGPPTPTAAHVPQPPSAASAGQLLAVPAATYSPRPVYPPTALRARLEGRVVLRVKINSAGQVIAASVWRSSGYDVLDQAARDAVRKWRFEPAQRSALRQADEFAVPVRFQLAD